MTTAGVAIDQFVANLSRRSFREAYLQFITKSGQAAKTFIMQWTNFLESDMFLLILTRK